MILLYCMKKHKGFVATNKRLVAVFGVLGFIIVGLVVGIFFNNWFNNGGSVGENNSVIDEKTNDSARALMLSENIIEKLSSEPDYNSEQAMDEYRNTYDVAEGEYKVYVAIEWAKFVDENFEDTNQAVEILSSVEEYTDNNAETDYLYAVIYYYEKLGDKGKVNYYRQILDDKYVQTENIYGVEGE